MGLLMTNELASFRLWTMIYLVVRIPRVVTSLALITPESLHSSSEVTTMISWSMTRGWSSYEATMKYGHKKKCPRVSKNLVVGVKQRADAGDTSPFSPMPLQISALSRTTRFCATCYVQQISLYRLLLPISTHVSAFLGPFLFAPDNLRMKTGFLGPLLKIVLGFEGLKHTILFCQHCAMHCIVRSSLTPAE